MPTVLAASTMRVPAGTVSLCPSMVRLMSGTCSHLADVAFVSQGVVLVLLAEVPEGRVDHPARGVAKAAEAAAALTAVWNGQKRVGRALPPLVAQEPSICPG